MAGYVKVDVFVRELDDSVTITPRPCPAQDVPEGPRPVCLSSRPNEFIRVCPFLLHTEAVVEGIMARHTDAEALIYDVRMWPNDAGGIKVMCLRCESKGTRIGAL